MFVDASAIVAILTREPEADRLAEALDAAEAPVTSAIAVFEAAIGIGRKRHASVPEGLEDVRALLAAARIEIIPIGEREAEAALEAFARYGKGRGHPAQLNLGDCFSYAAASVRGKALLFVGNDFSKTDIVNAASCRLYQGTKFPGNHIVTVLERSNPKAPNSQARLRYALYIDGHTVAENFANGVEIIDFTHDTSHNFVRIDPPAIAAEIRAKLKRTERRQ